MSASSLRPELRCVTAVDFDTLADLRVAAMRESLERVGRFDPQRARERLRSTFAPEHTRLILVAGERVGFHAVRPSPEGLRLDHLYIVPQFQNRGIGGMVLREILADADRRGLPILVGALKESASNRFYQRHGIIQTDESEWDIYYMRLPAAAKVLELTSDRYPEVLALMQRTPGVSVREADSPEATARYLARNPGLSFIAEVDGRVVGCAMCGHDGRRGYLQHVVVEPDHRRRGVAQALVARCLDGLAQLGIVKTHLDVLVTNTEAHAYWARRGWQRREDIQRYSFVRSASPNA